MAERDDPRRSSYLTDPAEAPAASGERVSFVSRSTAEELEERTRGPRETLPPPRLREWKMLLLFLLAIVLQFYSWHRLEGYQLADSVEYMERAHAVANGAQLQAEGALRSFGFSALLVPFFAVANWLGMEELLPVVHAVRLLQMFLGLGLVFVCVRLGARLAGPRIGYVAGGFCAINPIFLQYSVSPVSGIAAALFVGIALDCLIERAGFRRSLAGGLALGGAFLTAYQTILIILPLLALLFLRDRFKRFRHLGGALTGLALGIGIQILLDRWSYGVWGVSIRNYLIENVGGVTSSFLLAVGMKDTQFARDFYEAYAAHLGAASAEEGAEAPSKVEAFLWYATELHRMLVWPVMAVTVLGFLKCWLEASWKSTILVVLLLLNATVISLKGSQSFRLWLPLLPMLTPIAAWGWGSLRGTELARPGAWRAVAGVAVLVGGIWLGMGALTEINTRKHGGYWEAIEFVNEATAEERVVALAEGREWAPPRVSSVYHWAVFGRCSRDVELVKLENHVYQWKYLDEEARTRLLKEVITATWLILHKPVLDIDPALTKALNGNFEMVASFWKREHDLALGDVRVLRNRATPEPGARSWEGVRPRRLWEFLETTDPEAYRREHQLDHRLLRPLTFFAPGKEGRPQRLHLLGYEYEELPGTGFGWITYHWWTDTGFDIDYWVVDRVLVRGGTHAWHNNHVPAYGNRPTSLWKAGTLLREGYVLVPGSEPMAEDFRPFGGPWRRGDVLPARLWLKTIGYDEDGQKVVGLRPTPRGEDRPLKMTFDVPPSPWMTCPEGYTMSRDRMILVGAFPIPVEPLYRWPDDGTPDPE